MLASKSWGLRLLLLNRPLSVSRLHLVPAVALDVRPLLSA